MEHKQRALVLDLTIVRPLFAALGNLEASLKVPDKYRDYECSEYFFDGWAECGYFDDKSQTQIVTPLGEAYEDSEISFFAVGRSGVGSIDFGYRKGHAGLWAFHPIDQEFQLMAVTITELVDGWCSGKLAV